MTDTLKNDSVDPVPTSAAVERVMAALHAMGVQSDEPDQEYTLTDLILGLNVLGINVLSPAEQMAREDDARKRKRAEIIAEAFDRVKARAKNYAHNHKVGLLQANPTAIAVNGPGPSAATAELETAVNTSPASSASATAVAHVTAAPAANVASPTIAGTSTAGTASAPVGNAADNTLNGFVCVNCNAFNLLRPSKEAWYCVTIGTSVGMFRNWELVQPLVIGTRGACFKKYWSEAEAQAAFDAAANAGLVRIVE